MKRTLFTLVLLVLFVLPVFSHSWVNVAKKVQRSLVQLRTLDGEGYCSGWVLDNKRDYIITAAHCIHSPWYFEGGAVVDGISGTLAFENSGIDIAVLSIPGLDRPELAPAHYPLTAGLPVLASGFGWAKTQPDQRAGIISHPARDYSDWNLPGTWVVVDNSYIRGMSGGPVVDADGKVVAMVQRGDRNDYTGYGKSIDDIWRLTRGYWRK